MKKNDVTVLKYLDAIKYFKHKIEVEKNYSFANLQKDKKISGKIGVIMVNGGLCKNVSTSLKFPKWIWITIEPNYHMAEKIVNILREQNRENHEINFKKKEKGMKTKVRQSTIEKYVNILVELKTMLKYTDEIEMTKYMRENKISNSFVAVLSQLNIIKCISRHPSRWEWVGDNPSKKMAFDISNAITKMTLDSRIKTQSTAKKRVDVLEVKEIKPIKKGVEMSFFWGLFTFKN
jgi:hypothetical protein